MGIILTYGLLLYKHLFYYINLIIVRPKRAQKSLDMFMAYMAVQRGDVNVGVLTRLSWHISSFNWVWRGYIVTDLIEGKHNYLFDNGLKVKESKLITFEHYGAI